MNAVSCPFLDSVAIRWSEVVPSLPSRGVRSQVRLSPALEKMVIEVEASAHVAAIEAWEHAHCLDVTIVHVESGASTVLSAGPCSNAGEIDIRLLSLRDALLKNESN